MAHRPYLINCALRQTTPPGTTLLLSSLSALTGAAGLAAARDSAGALADADTTDVFIQQVDGDDVPTGKWESCLATVALPAATLTRGTVYASSSGTSRVDFDGAVIVYVGPAARLVAASIADSTTAGRALLTAADAAAQRTALELDNAATVGKAIAVAIVFGG